MKLIGAQRQHTGSKVKFGFVYTWIHWIKPNGDVIIVATKGERVPSPNG